MSVHRVTSPVRSSSRTRQSPGAARWRASRFDPIRRCQLVCQPSLPQLGVTTAQAQSLMPGTVYLNFMNNPSIDAAVTSMGDVEIARLSTELARNDTMGYTYSIMVYAGEKLSAANLHRLQAAVGPTVFAPALASMPAATLASYNATRCTHRFHLEFIGRRSIPHLRRARRALEMRTCTIFCSMKKRRVRAKRQPLRCRTCRGTLMPGSRTPC